MIWYWRPGALGALGLMTVLSAAAGFALPSLLPRVYTHYASVVLFAVFGQTPVPNHVPNSTSLFSAARTSSSHYIPGCAHKPPPPTFQPSPSLSNTHFHHPTLPL